MNAVKEREAQLGSEREQIKTHWSLFFFGSELSLFLLIQHYHCV